MVHHLNNDRFDEKTINQAWELIKSAQKVTLLTHKTPDGDGISACAAMDEILLKYDISVECIYPSAPEQELHRHAHNVLINNHGHIPDLIIAFDTANYERLYYPDVFKKIPLINIDHHVSNKINGLYNLVDGQASSTCELLFQLLHKWDPANITSSVAESLLVGLLYDSQVFQTQSTTPQTLRIAADLMDRGAALFTLKNDLFTNKNPQIISLWGDLLQRTIVVPDKQATWTYLTQHDLRTRNVDMPAVVGFNNFLAQISAVDITLFLYETATGETKVSLRSKQADVNKLAQRFGGGGHKHASGILSSTPIDQLAPLILAQINKS